MQDPKHGIDRRCKVIEKIRPVFVCLITLRPILRVSHLSFRPGKIHFAAPFDLAFSGKTIIAKNPILSGKRILRIDALIASGGHRVVDHEKSPFFAAFFHVNRKLSGKTTANSLDFIEKSGKYAIVFNQNIFKQ